MKNLSTETNSRKMAVKSFLVWSIGLLLFVSLVQAGKASEKVHLVCLLNRLIGIVKRDTIQDIGDSLEDALGINEDKGLLEELEDLNIDVGKPPNGRMVYD